LFEQLVVGKAQGLLDPALV
jgi:hypothetical protein